MLFRPKPKSFSVLRENLRWTDHWDPSVQLMPLGILFQNLFSKTSWSAAFPLNSSFSNSSFASLKSLITLISTLPNLTKASGCAVTLLSRPQLRKPFERSKNGREPSKGTLGGPGGIVLFLWNITLIRKRRIRKIMSREASSIEAVVIFCQTAAQDWTADYFFAMFSLKTGFRIRIVVLG